MNIPKGTYFLQNEMTPCYIGSYAGEFGYPYHGMIESVRISTRPIPEVGKIPDYTGKEEGTLMFVDFSKGNSKPVVEIPSAKMKYLLPPELKNGRDGRKALWFNDEK